MTNINPSNHPGQESTNVLLEFGYFQQKKAKCAKLCSLIAILIIILSLFTGIIYIFIPLIFITIIYSVKSLLKLKDLKDSYKNSRSLKKAYEFSIIGTIFTNFFALWIMLGSICLIFSYISYYQVFYDMEYALFWLIILFGFFAWLYNFKAAIALDQFFNHLFRKQRITYEIDKIIKASNYINQGTGLLIIPFANIIGWILIYVGYNNLGKGIEQYLKGGRKTEYYKKNQYSNLETHHHLQPQTYPETRFYNPTEQRYAHPRSNNQIIVSEEPHFCTYCGTKIEQSAAKYCANCGNQIK